MYFYIYLRNYAVDVQVYIISALSNMHWKKSYVSFHTAREIKIGSVVGNG